MDTPPLVFFEEIAKIKAVFNQEPIFLKVLTSFIEEIFDFLPFLVQQDGAPTHSANRTQRWLRYIVPDLLSKLALPLSNPDRSLKDFLDGVPWKSMHVLTVIYQSPLWGGVSLEREWAEILTEFFFGWGRQKMTTLLFHMNLWEYQVMPFQKDYQLWTNRLMLSIRLKVIWKHTKNDRQQLYDVCTCNIVQINGVNNPVIGVWYSLTLYRFDNFF